MVRWKGYGLEHNKWVKHSDVFSKDTIDAYYHHYPNTPRWIISATFNLLSFWRCNKTICFIRRNTVFQGGGVMSGEPLLRPVFRLLLQPLSPFQPDLLQTLLCPMLQMVFQPLLQILLHPL
jgi:hypothetical protein